MKREDISKQFPDATEEQISNLLDINSKDIGKAKGEVTKMQSDLDAANEALKNAQDTIAALEAAKGNAEEIQKKLDEYIAADEKRKADEQAAAERAELMERMDAVLGDRKFAHDRLRDVVAEDFANALKDKANRGKSDKDVFDALTKDQGYFANQNPAQMNMPPMGDPRPTDIKDMTGFLKLSYDEQVQFKQAHPTEFKQMLESQTNNF